MTNVKITALRGAAPCGAAEVYEATHGEHPGRQRSSSKHSVLTADSVRNVSLYDESVTKYKEASITAVVLRRERQRSVQK